MRRFVTIEGGDGAGKTTQVRLLDDYLGARGVSRLVTREPGETGVGRTVRRILMERGEASLAAGTELFLILADRAQHVHEVIRPALEAGRFVLCDRFTDSTLAYQGYGRGMDLDLLREANRLATGGAAPELTIILDCPVEAARARLGRRSGRSAPADRFEAEGAEFHQRVREGFLALAEADPDRCRVIDADAPVEAVRAQVERVIEERLT